MVMQHHQVIESWVRVLQSEVRLIRLRMGWLMHGSIRDKEDMQCLPCLEKDPKP